MPAEALETLLLLASELVANAVTHGAGPVRISVAEARDGEPLSVRVGVDDADPNPPRRRRPGPAPDAFPPESGRGVLLLDTMASRWGVSAAPPGKQVWFELDLGP